MSSKPSWNEPADFLKEILWMKQSILEINDTLKQIKSTNKSVYRIQNNETIPKSSTTPSLVNSSTMPMPPPIVTSPYPVVSPTSMPSPTSMYLPKSPSRKVSIEHVFNQLPQNRTIERVPSEYCNPNSTSFYGEIVPNQTYQTQTQQHQQILNAQQQALCVMPIHKSAIKMSYNGMRLHEHNKPIYYTLSEGIKKYYVIID
jgi:hypothetical protein